MARAALALLLAASLPQAGASLDAPEAEALSRRFAWRRLSGDGNESIHNYFPQACIDVCPELEPMFAAKAGIDQEYPDDEVPDPPWKKEEEVMGMWCDYMSAVECALESDNCNGSNGATFIGQLKPILDCVCQCPGGKAAFAKAEDDDDSHDDGNDDDAVDTTDDPSAGWRAEEDTNFTQMQQCAMYTLALCPATECSVLNINYTDDYMNQLESICTGTTTDAPGEIGDDDNASDDGGDDDNASGTTTASDDNASDDGGDDGADVVGSCGPVGLGWIAASLAPMIAALQFVAA